MIQFDWVNRFNGVHAVGEFSELASFLACFGVSRLNSPQTRLNSPISSGPTFCSVCYSAFVRSYSSAATNCTANSTSEHVT